MSTTTPLKPAADMARHDRRFPNESAEYREARTALLAEEIELRRHIERVAAQRRALPLGGTVPEDFRFEGEHGPVLLSEMFGDKRTLVTYNWMFGPQRQRPCPMCTSLLGPLDRQMPDIEQHVAFAVIARSPIERMAAFRRERGWRHLKLYSSADNVFNRHYAFEDPGSGEDSAAFNVFTRSGDDMRHVWADEMGAESADPGQDPRGAVDAMPLWKVLDITPEGRPPDWRTKLEYDDAQKQRLQTLQRFPLFAYLPTRDIARARRFYEQQLGLKPAALENGGVTYDFAGGTAAFLYPSDNAGTSKASQAFWQVDDVERVVAELKGRGVEFEDYDMAGEKSPSGVVAAGGTMAAWFEDPDGNILALVQDA